MLTLDSLDLQHQATEELGELLIEAKKAYYTGGHPIMDDHTYDTLEAILLEKAPYHRLFSKVGHPNFDTGFDKKKHTMFMGSQNKVSTFTDLVHYFELKKISPNTEFIVEPKCDGISLEIVYKNGQLIEAITRGDGQVGDLITQNVVQMKNFVAHPQNLTGSVRCEIMVTKKDFTHLNVIAGKEKQSLAYSNPRNAASGISQRLDSKFSEYCSLYAVDISPYSGSETEKISYLKSLGFTTVDIHLCQNPSQIETIYQKFFLSDRNAHPYEIDGLVVKINDPQICHNLGIKNNRPQYQVAYKFPSATDTTTVKAITWQVGPLGTITPVAQVEPIELSGAIITFASLANHDLITKMNLNIGDIVKISRRGDVIPHIESVITKVNSGHISLPTHCPSCQSLLIKQTKALRCPNSNNCLSQVLGSLRLFCSTLDILGLSEKTIVKLYDSGKVRLPGDFYNLKIDDIKNLENLGEISAKNIINQIQSKKTLSLVDIFTAAAVPNFSKKRIHQLISAGFNTPEKLLDISLSDIEPLPGFQITLAQKIVAGIHLRHQWIQSILNSVKIKNLKFKIKNLEGLSFCITGDLSVPRKQLEETITNNGGKVQSTVSKNTSYLITNETSSNSSKLVTAKKLNIKIISESEFKKLIG